MSKASFVFQESQEPKAQKSSAPGRLCAGYRQSCCRQRVQHFGAGAYGAAALAQSTGARNCQVFWFFECFVFLMFF